MGTSLLSIPWAINQVSYVEYMYYITVFLDGCVIKSLSIKIKMSWGNKSLMFEST